MSERIIVDNRKQPCYVREIRIGSGSTRRQRSQSFELEIAVTSSSDGRQSWCRRCPSWWGKRQKLRVRTVLTDWGEAVTIFKAGVLFELHTLKTRGFISRLATDCTSEIDAIETSMDSYTEATGRRKKRLARPCPSILWSRLGER
jgi:hypothetical protein